MTNVAMLPGLYRVHLESELRDGPFYLDVEVKPKFLNRAYVRAVGAPVQDGVKTPFLKMWIYTDSLAVGQQCMFNGTKQLVSKIEKVELLRRA